MNAATRPTRNELAHLLAAFKERDEDVYLTSLGGQCDAFAQALATQIETRWAGTGAKPVIVERFRIGQDSGEVLEHNPFSHVVLEVPLAHGDTALVDGGGLEADVRWEEDWIQPGHDDEVEPSEDTFQYTTTTFSDIETRRQRDRQGAGVDTAWVARFAEALSVVAMPMAGRRPRGP